MNKLLVSDFDNTFYNNNVDYLKNIEYVNKFVDKGNYFVIATGRHIGILLPAIKPFNIKYNYLICNDGGIIFDKNLKIIYQKDIPNEIIAPIAKIIDKNIGIGVWYIDTGTYITTNTNSNANGIIGKILNFNNAEELLNYITSNYKEVHGYLSTGWINITEKTVTKQSVIELLSTSLKIDNQSIYTIGDNINDVSMSVYNSYCMTNSVPELKAVCQKEYDAVYLLIQDILDGKI